jgi:hypothetical protein
VRAKEVNVGSTRLKINCNRAALGPASLLKLLAEGVDLLPPFGVSLSIVVQYADAPHPAGLL